MMKILRQLSWKTPIAALITAAILHIGLTLLAPRFAGASVVRRIFNQKLMPVNQMRVLPPASPEVQAWPFLGPDVRLAVCPFDASSQGVLARAKLPDVGWVFAVYSLEGDNIYAVAGTPDRSTDMSVLLIPPTDDDVEAGGVQRSADKDAEVTLSARRGLIVVRAPDRGRSYVNESEAVLRQATCTVLAR